MMCEHCGYRRAMRGLIVCKKCLSEFEVVNVAEAIGILEIVKAQILEDQHK